MRETPQEMLAYIRKNYPNIVIVPYVRMFNIIMPTASTNYTFQIPDDIKAIRFNASGSPLIYSFRGGPSLPPGGSLLYDTLSAGEGMMHGTIDYTPWYYVQNTSQVSFKSPTSNIRIGIEMV